MCPMTDVRHRHWNDDDKRMQLRHWLVHSWCAFSIRCTLHTRTNAINIWISKETDCCTHFTHHLTPCIASLFASGSTSATTATIKLDECCHKFVVVQFCERAKIADENFFRKLSVRTYTFPGILQAHTHSRNENVIEENCCCTSNGE